MINERDESVPVNSITGEAGGCADFHLQRDRRSVSVSTGPGLGQGKRLRCLLENKEKICMYSSSFVSAFVI